MKKSGFIFILCLIGFCFAANDQKVTVVGFATEKKSTKEAYENALQNALRNAVEKNLGTWIKSQSSSVNFSDANSLNQAKYDILSKANDFIVNYKVLKRGLSSKGLYEVTIEAVVSTDILSGELRKYVGELKSKMDNPSIAFVLTSWEKKGVFTTVTSNASLSSKNSYSGNTESSIRQRRSCRRRFRPRPKLQSRLFQPQFFRIRKRALFRFRKRRLLRLCKWLRPCGWRRKFRFLSRKA